MLFYGLLDRELQEVIEFYPSKEAAEAELQEILGDEPGWVTKLEVVVVDFETPPMVRAVVDPTWAWYPNEPTSAIIAPASWRVGKNSTTLAVGLLTTP